VSNERSSVKSEEIKLLESRCEDLILISLIINFKFAFQRMIYVEMLWQGDNFAATLGKRGLPISRRRMTLIRTSSKLWDAWN
jgi:hypothetical protein